MQVMSGWVAIVVLALSTAKAAIDVFGKERPESPPADYPPEVWPLWYAPFAFVHTRTFGGLFLLGMVLDALWTQLR
jgi:1,4-dihydroxy-2-naphthoate octaprenyltransferase